jgi:hypothetical protein
MCGDFLGKVYRGMEILLEKARYSWKPLGSFTSLCPDVFIGCVMLTNRNKRAGPMSRVFGHFQAACCGFVYKFLRDVLLTCLAKVNKENMILCIFQRDR